MNQIIKNLLIAIIGGAILFGVFFYWRNSKQSAVRPNQKTEQTQEDKKTQPGINTTGMPLKLPDGFSIEIFAKDLPGARVMAFDGVNHLAVSQTSEAIVSWLTLNKDKIESQGTLFKGLKKPHGLAYSSGSPGDLYIAEENKISRVVGNTKTSFEKIADLPTSGGGHFTRTIGFGPDGLLYVSIGSSCNVCGESDERRASIYTMKPDGSDFKSHAKGLRNTVFFTWDKDGKMWGNDMGRDNLGDNLPPEEINIIEHGKDYGWPVCYGNKIHDSNFDKNQYLRDPCQDTVTPKIEMPAHSAPLGIAFIPKGFGPKDWEGDLIVALHGSWNRSEPTGYKLVRVHLSPDGNFEWFEDFVTGWLQGGEALGRPVDVKFHDNALYVSDDKAGVIYKIAYGSKE